MAVTPLYSLFYIMRKIDANAVILGLVGLYLQGETEITDTRSKPNIYNGFCSKQCKIFFFKFINITIVVM